MDYIILGILAVIIYSAIAYIIKEKKKGVKCIGCSSAGTCAGRQHDQDHHSCSSK